MSVTFHIRTYFAIEASLSSFYVDTGERETVCKHNERHQVNPNAKFCEHCGSPLTTKVLMKPTEAFEEFSKKLNATPDEAFTLLKDGGWEWSNDQGEKYSIGWHAVNPVDSGDCEDRLMALGIRLTTYVIEGRDKVDEVSYNNADFTKFSKIILEVMSALKIEGVPKLYVQVYVSC